MKLNFKLNEHDGLLKLRLILKLRLTTYTCAIPPSTGTSVAVIKEASVEAKNKTVLATSVPFPNLPSGTCPDTPAAKPPTSSSVKLVFVQIESKWL